jgi:ferredoxin
MRDRQIAQAESRLRCHATHVGDLEIEEPLDVSTILPSSFSICIYGI